MHFICTRENLSRALAFVIGVAGKSVNLPILANVLIHAADQGVTFVATNLEVAIISHLRAKVENVGSFTAPARTLNDFVNLLSDEKVEVEVADNEIHLVSGRSSTKIKGSPADEFPVVPASVDGKGYVVEAEALKKGLEQVMLAAAKNDIRPELSGVLCVFNVGGYGGLTLAATDSYRLAEKKIKLEQGQEEARVIMPLRTAQELNHLLSQGKGAEAERTVRLQVTENQIVARSNEVELISRLVEGQYPDYTQIIPKDFLTTAEFETEKMAKEIKAASLFATNGVNAVSLELKTTEGVVAVSSASTQTGEHKSEVAAEVRGENNSTLLNHRYVLDGLSNIGASVGILKLINPESPCVFVPKGDDSYLYIVMPIRQ